MAKNLTKQSKLGPWLDHKFSILFPRYGLKRVMARRAFNIVAETGDYRGSSSDRLRKDWTLKEVKPTPLSWELGDLRDRARDLNRNDPISAGATDTLSQNIVGRGLRPQSLIRADRIGLSEEATRELRSAAEDIFSRWSPYADATGRLGWNEIQFLAIRKIIEDGEIIINPIMVNNSWRPFGRTLELIEADRLKTPREKMSDKSIVQGIQLGESNEPLKYWIKKVNAKTWNEGTDQFLGIPARDSDGRPMILHCYPTKRPGQLRGIPLFAPVLTYFKDLADYLEAEIVAARIAACLAVFVTKTDAYGAAVSASTEQEAGTGARLETIEPGVVSYLAPGEGISVVEPKRGGDTFGSFLTNFLRIIGAMMGIPYELLLKDFSKTNYSSARAALLEGRRVFLTWREWFAARVCQPIWELVLEEAYYRGFFPVRDFKNNRQELCRASWRGGAWGWVDPVKEVESSGKARQYGLTTLADEAAGQGRDWEENIEQIARENDRAKSLGVSLEGPQKQAFGG